MSNMYDGKRMIINREPQRIDLRTDFGKGITFKSDDGHEHASMKDANKASQEYWDRMMNDTSKKIICIIQKLKKHILIVLP